MKVCKFCGNPTKVSERCKSCSNKQRAWRIPSLCLDCKKEITYGSLRCNKCKAQKILNGNYKNGITEEKYCIDCDKKLSSYYYVERCKPCNAKKRFSIPENNPNYIDGRSFEEYPEEFNKELKLEIRERDNFECQNCSMTEEEHIVVYGNVLDIHHINYNKQDNVKENLISVCRACNIRANYNRSYWLNFYTTKVKEIYIREK